MNLNASNLVVILVLFGLIELNMTIDDVVAELKNKMVTVTAEPKNLQDSSNVDTLRIIRSYATSIYLQCPLQSKLNNEVISVHQIKWINEINDFNKPDSSVVVNSLNLMAQAQINFQLKDRYTYVSCGKFLLS